MKKDEIEVGQAYTAKVSGNLTTVVIETVSPHGGWDAINTRTGKRVRIKSAQRLRRKTAQPRFLGPKKPNPRYKAPAKRGEELKAIHKADQENARLADERAASGDGMTASERAMAESAPSAKKSREAAGKGQGREEARHGRTWGVLGPTQTPVGAQRSREGARRTRPRRRPVELRADDRAYGSQGLLDARPWRQDARQHAVRGHPPRDQHQGRGQPLREGRTRPVHTGPQALRRPLTFPPGHPRPPPGVLRVPGTNLRFRGNPHTDRCQTCGEGLALRGEASFLVGVEEQTLAAQLLPQDAVLLAQVLDDFLLLPIHPAGDGHDDELPRCEGHGEDGSREQSVGQPGQDTVQGQERWPRRLLAIAAAPSGGYPGGSPPGRE